MPVGVSRTGRGAAASALGRKYRDDSRKIERRVRRCLTATKNFNKCDLKDHGQSYYLDHCLISSFQREGPRLNHQCISLQASSLNFWESTARVCQMKIRRRF